MEILSRDTLAYGTTSPTWQRVIDHSRPQNAQVDRYSTFLHWTQDKEYDLSPQQSDIDQSIPPPQKKRSSIRIFPSLSNSTLRTITTYGLLVFM